MSVMTRPNGGGLLRPQDLDIGSFFESMQDAVIVAEAFTGRIVLWNPVASVVFGYSPVEALGMNVDEFVPGRLKARHRGEMSAYRETGRSPYIDSGTVLNLPAVRKDGEEIHVELTLSTIEPARNEGVQGQFMLAIVRDVTVRDRAEEEARRLNAELEQRIVEATTQLEAAGAALRDSEERYRWLVESLRDYAIFIVEADGRLANWNLGAERIFGYREVEIIDKDFSILFTPEDIRQGVPERELREAAAEGRAEDERWHVRKDGSRFWASGIVAPIRDETGNLRGFTKVARDLTERKQTEESLRESSRRISNILESITDEFFAVDREWRFTYVNERALRRIQREKGEDLTREKLLGKNAWELYPELVGSVFYQKYHEALREQKTVELEAYSPLRDRWFETHAYPSWEGLSVYYRDITDRKRTQKEIETHTHQQAVVAELGRRALAETELSVLMDEAVALVANTLGVEYCEVLELLPSGDELLLRAGVGWEEGLVGSATVGAGLDSQAGYTLLSSEPVVVKDLHTEERFQGPPLLHQHRVLSGMSVVIYSGDGPFGVLGAHTKEQRAFSEDAMNFLQAVANVLAAAIERVEAEGKLREVREAERSRLARDLHDEALQDLTWALAATQLVQRTSEDPKLNYRLERVGEALKRVGQGIHAAIYDLRLEGEARELTLVEMLESLVELSRRSSPDCEIELSVEEGFSPTLSRAQQVELLRTLREALTNALRHSGADRVRIAAGTSGGNLWAKVDDDGRGFDPTKTGAGMGLKGMRERARTLGGDLQISSNPGEGTKVRFELNLEKDREEPEEEVRILLVEDHASVRQATASVFDREPGFRVVGQAGSLSEARKMLDGVDVAVIDLGLPDGYGGELVKELRTHSPQAQALVLSGILSRADIARAVESGAAGVLHKSVEIDEVVEAVRHLRAGETLLPLEEVVELLRFAGSRREEEYEARQVIARLTSREKEVLQALAEGLDSKEIAERLYISVKTEANHMTSILNKLGVHSRLQALVFAVRHGVVEIH